MLLLRFSPGCTEGETRVANLGKNINASELKISEHASLLSISKRTRDAREVIMKNVRLARQKLVMVFTILSI